MTKFCIVFKCEAHHFILFNNISFVFVCFFFVCFLLNAFINGSPRDVLLCKFQSWRIPCLPPGCHPANYVVARMSAR